MSKNINFPYISYFTKNLHVTTKLMNRNSYYITSFIPFFKRKKKSFILRIKIIIIPNLISIQQIKRVLPISMERQTPTYHFFCQFYKRVWTFLFIKEIMDPMIQMISHVYISWICIFITSWLLQEDDILIVNQHESVIILFYFILLKTSLSLLSSSEDSLIIITS